MCPSLHELGWVIDSGYSANFFSSVIDHTLIATSIRKKIKVAKLFLLVREDFKIIF
jgi:hypothetical protein